MDAKIVALLKTAEDISKRLDRLIDDMSVLTDKNKRFATNVAALDERLSFLENRQCGGESPGTDAADGLPESTSNV